MAISYRELKWKRKEMVVDDYNKKKKKKMLYLFIFHNGNIISYSAHLLFQFVWAQNTSSILNCSIQQTYYYVHCILTHLPVYVEIKNN